MIADWIILGFVVLLLIATETDFLETIMNGGRKPKDEDDTSIPE